jgi:isoamylase
MGPNKSDFTAVDCDVDSLTRRGTKTRAGHEDNRDGSNDNRSWNCGVEGQTNDPDVERLRNRQVKNFMTVTMLSLGMPMFVMGDEFRRTQHGNNNTYSQDNDTNWLDWSLLERHADVHRFVQLLIARRLLRNLGPEQERMSLTQLISGATKNWHGVNPNQPDWSYQSHSVAFSAELRREGLLVYFIFNAYWEPLEFQLPRIENGRGGPWRRWVDTFLEAPNEIVPWQEAPLVSDHTYRAGARSVVVLWASLREEARPTS